MCEANIGNQTVFATQRVITVTFAIKKSSLIVIDFLIQSVLQSER